MTNLISGFFKSVHKFFAFIFRPILKSVSTLKVMRRNLIHREKFLKQFNSSRKKRLRLNDEL